VGGIENDLDFEGFVDHVSFFNGRTLMMIRRTILTGAVALTLVFGLTASTEAQIFLDDFNDEPGSSTLTGQTANTGQTWTLQPGSSGHITLGVDTTFGQGGSRGAGITDSGTPGDTFYRNTALLGSTLSEGSFVFSVDINRATGGPRPSAGLLEGGGTGPGEFQVSWDGSALKTFANKWNGLNQDIGVSTGDLHIDVAFDLSPGTNTAELTYSGAANGVIDLGTIGGTIAFDAVLMNVYAANNLSGTAGMDNLSLVPEPGTLMMLTIALGMLVAGSSRRR
jgi:hypothetical protein